MPVNQSYASAGVTTIEIELRRGDVGIDVGTGDEIILRADFSSGANEADLRVERVGDALRIIQTPADVPREGFGFLNDLGLGALVGQIGRIDLRLSVPPGARRLLTTTGLGAVRVAEWTGNLQIRTGKGDVTLGTVDGQSDVKTGMGAVQVERVSGQCTINDGLGDVIVAGGSGAVHAIAGKGAIRVRDASLTLEAKSGMGDVVLERVSGEAKIHSGFGQIAVDEARELVLESQSGNGSIRLSGDFRSIKAKSGMGPIGCQPTRLTGPVDLNTGNGDLDLLLATDQALRIDASTGRGRVNSEVPLVQVGQSGPPGYFSQRLVGTVGSGEIAATVRLRSGNGDIRLRRSAASSAQTGPSAGQSARAGSATASASTSAEASAGTTFSSTITVETHTEQTPSSDAAPKPGRSRLEVLQALSRGEITVEEAERELTQA
jgi:DUF4097 and DUF4098 domain-containing protein YvlB